MYMSQYDINPETRSPEREFYQEFHILLESAITNILSRIDFMQKYKQSLLNRKPIEHYKARIKSANSMKEKLLRKNLPVTVESAINEIHDGAGIRIICTFLDDIYWVVTMLKKQPDLIVYEEKDYIHNPKPNGYRSYHMILKVPIYLDQGVQMIFCEVQIRTIAMDCWASLEHHMKYKKNIHNQEMMIRELKRCSDEIASTDLNFQTIWDMIKEMEQISETKD